MRVFDVLLMIQSVSHKCVGAAVLIINVLIFLKLKTIQQEVACVGAGL